MFKSQEEQISVLGICVEDPARVGRFETLNFCAVRSGRRAIDMMRMLSFDMVVVGDRLPDTNTWDFVRRLKTGFAQQKWAYVGGMISDEQERTARMFGAIKVYDVMPSSDELIELTAALRRKAAANVFNQAFGQAPVRPVLPVQGLTMAAF